MFPIEKLIAAVKAVAAAVSPKASASIAAAEAVFDLAKDVRATLAEEDQAKLDAALPELLRRMNRNVDQGLRDLRGD